MATTERNTVPVLEIRRTLNATPERVFDAWTNAEELTRWFRPSDDVTVAVLEHDVRVGGAYRIEMRGKNGVHSLRGTYRELRRPNRLAFTWRWAERPNMKDSLVTIDLAERDGKTELVLVHSQFESEEDRLNHEQGWEGCLARLGRLA